MRAPPLMPPLGRSLLPALLAVLLAGRAQAATVAIDGTQRFQTIDGFGTFAGAEANEAWWQQLYFDDLGASITRMDLTPPFVAPYSQDSYCSPWFGQAAPLRLDNNGQGPDGTRTRRYTSASDYTDLFGGCTPQIAVMGTDIDANAALLNLGPSGPEGNAGALAQLGFQKAAHPGDFKLYASQWSPAPWLKVSSGNTYSGGSWPGPTAVAWPFIWGGNFAGGKLDVSGTALPVFNDGTADTSALTQFGRSLAAFLHGFQKSYGVTFYAVSIQNELNFEEFYNSATYPLSDEYIAALVAARAELDAHDDTKDIKIIGPEDLIGGDPYALWQYGSGAGATHKNLQYVTSAEANAPASAALAGFAIHGYAPDGVSAAGANSAQWAAWANGWTASPAGGIPANIAGFTSYGKPSWMTETSGEQLTWLSSSGGAGGFPDQGAFSIAVKIHQALSTGMESAWLYWQMTSGSPSSASTEALTDSDAGATAPKYNAAKHFFRYIRPGAQRVAATVSGASALLATAYVHDANHSVTAVLVNEDTSSASVKVTLPEALVTSLGGLTSVSTYTSSDGALWQTGTAPLANGAVTVSVPSFGVLTLVGIGTGPDGGVTAPDAGADAGLDAGPMGLPDAGADAGVAADAGGDGGEALDGGAGDGGRDAGADAGPGSALDGGNGSAGGGEQVTGGCGCALGRGDPLESLAALALAVAATRRRRR